MEKSYIESLDKTNLLAEETFVRLFEIEDGLEREIARASLEIRANELKIAPQFNRLYKAFQKDFFAKTKAHCGNQIAFSGCPLPGLYCGDWEATDSGVSRMSDPPNGGAAKQIVACPHPVLPVARLVNLDTEMEKIKIAFRKNSAWKSFIVDRAVCANKNKITDDFANRGVEITSETAREMVQYLSEVTSKNLRHIPVFRSASRCGWIGEKFIPYETDVLYDGDGEHRQVFQDIATQGSFEHWVRLCAALRENLFLRLQMAASFASVLIDRVNALPFVFHLWGGTGTGKTVGLMVAMSIWGNPALGGLVKTMNMTANAMAEYASFLRHLPFAGDELQIIKDNWGTYDRLIMYLTEGVNRGRLHATGKIEEQKTWRNSFLFTGEEPITKAQSGGGVKNRVIEVGLQGEDYVIRDGNFVVNFLSENHGHAGKVFLESLKNWDLKGRYRAIFAQILDTVDTTEKQAMAMALMLLADEIASGEIFHTEPLSVDEVKRFLASAKEVDVAARAFDWFQNWVARNHIRFASQSDGNNGEIWGRVDDNVVVVNRDVLAEQLAKAGFDYTATTRQWGARGQLIRTPQGKFVHRTHAHTIKGNYLKILLPDEFKDTEAEGVFDDDSNDFLQEFF